MDSQTATVPTVKPTRQLSLYVEKLPYTAMSSQMPNVRHSGIPVVPSWNIP